MFRQVLDYAAYIVVRLFFCVVQALPLSMCGGIARAMAVLAADVLKIRRRVIEENLSHAFPQFSPRQRKRIARGMWEHLVLMLCEVAQAQRKIHLTNWRNHVRLAGTKPMIDRFLERRPAIILSAHFGNFEVAGFLAGLFGFPSHTIARPLDNPHIHRYITRFRESGGQYMLPKRDIAGQVTDLLKSGGKLALLGDQFGGEKGCWVEFFGRRASYHKGIALFSLTSGAPIVVMYTKRLGSPLQFELGVLGVFDPTAPENRGAGIQEVTQWYNDLLEQAVRLDPQQYWWMHKRWKDPRREARLKRAAEAAASQGAPAPVDNAATSKAA